MSLCIVCDRPCHPGESFCSEVCYDDYLCEQAEWEEYWDDQEDEWGCPEGCCH